MDKNSKVLALKYRPQTFEDLIGQEIIAQTIINSIKSNKIPNAYLFTGIRGIGKTTTARIVAKSLNCLKGIENLCSKEKCENCEAITNSSHIDVLEMDAASKTGVDDVRDLIEFSRYGPTSSKFKIFIIDEVHMLSKQAFNALLKTLEEPPEYLKFIFATTEIKKIPITVVSRCQRFDLSRINSSELLSFIKKIKDKENGKISDEALKLIIKISEGSVRDALSLLDRALLTTDKNTEIYRKIYNQGVEPKIFINDFLEILYFFKNIDSLSVESTNFSLNDAEFIKIKEISSKVDNEILILFWQFTIKTLDELDIVSNQHLSIEMLLIRLMHLNNNKPKSQFEKKKIVENNENQNIAEKMTPDLINKETINQIKNISQETKLKPKAESEIKAIDTVSINSFKDLLSICNSKKEMNLKFELEKNVSLVKFEKGRIEISFNDNLNKNFVKDLSFKLFEWTGQRWIISFSKDKGKETIKEQEKNKKIKLIQDAKKTELYKEMINYFSDAELIDIKTPNKSEDK